MPIQYDEKGKYFTEIVSKQPIEVLIQTTAERVEGTVHLTPDHRLVDELNLPGGFLPVTRARILSPAGPVRTDFVALNKQHILWIAPAAEVEGGAGEH